MIRLRRTVLYVPADKPRALQKAPGLAADVVIIDLEDAVAPGNKESARAAAIAAAEPIAESGKEVVVRINASDTPWYHDDVAALRRGGFAALVLPKVKTPLDVKRVALRTGLCVWPMMETAQAVLEAKGIAEAAASTGPSALVFGSNDLAAELGAEQPPTRAPLATAMRLLVLAAKAAGVDIIDGVLGAYDDNQRLKQESNQARSFGFTGKSVIHPAQIDLVNRLFSPKPATIEEARRVVAAMREAEEAGSGVATLDGKMVEALHARAAEHHLAMAAAVAERAAALEAAKQAAAAAAEEAEPVAEDPAAIDEPVLDTAPLAEAPSDDTVPQDAPEMAEGEPDAPDGEAPVQPDDTAPETEPAPFDTAQTDATEAITLDDDAPDAGTAEPFTVPDETHQVVGTDAEPAEQPAPSDPDLFAEAADEPPADETPDAAEAAEAPDGERSQDETSASLAAAIEEAVSNFSLDDDDDDDEPLPLDGLPPLPMDGSEGEDDLADEAKAEGDGDTRETGDDDAPAEDPRDKTG